MSLGHEHGLVLIGLAGPMDVVNLSPSLSCNPDEPRAQCCEIIRLYMSAFVAFAFDFDQGTAGCIASTLR